MVAKRPAFRWQGDVRCDPNASQKVWIERGKTAEIDHKIGPQVMRRSLNTMMLAEGMDRMTLRSIMGHTSEPMTQRDAGVGDDAKADALVRVRPVLRVVKPEEAEELKAS